MRRNKKKSRRHKFLALAQLFNRHIKVQYKD